MSILEFEYAGLKKIVSGGQCGTDRGALEAAKECSFPTGGWAPKLYRTTFGSDFTLKEFGLKEHTDFSYTPRTQLNVLESDGTLIISTNLNSPGTVLTINTCSIMKKPFYCVKLPCTDWNKLNTELVKFCIDNQIKVLNVAGNRDKKDDPCHHSLAFFIVGCLISELNKINKLDTSPD
jgi:hypothetical protein